MKSASLNSFALFVFLLIPSLSSGGINITSFPYLNNFDSQGDVNEATHADSECIGEIMYEATGGWNNTGAYKMRLVDHPSPNCPKSEDTAGIGTFSWPSLGGQTHMNIGMLVYFGPNFYQPTDDNDLIKWILYGASNGERPMLALRHFGHGRDDKVWQACQGASGSGCQDEFGYMYPTDHGAVPSDYSFRFSERQGEWIWIEWESVVGGNNTMYIYTQDGALSGRYVSCPSGLGNGVTLRSFNELAYWEGASNTTSETYVKYDMLTISNRYIGPPPGFSGGSAGGGGGALPAPTELRIVQ